MDSIESLFPALLESKAIICDLRGRPNRNDDFISHLLQYDDTTKAWLRKPYIIYPDSNRKTEYIGSQWSLKAKKPYLGNKNVYFLTGPMAISYAESYMSYIEGYNLGTIIGQPTAGTNGNVNPFDLPGGLTIRWTGMKAVKHDGSQFHGIGVLPNIYVKPSIKGIAEGRDEILEKAIELAKAEIAKGQKE